MNYKLLAVVWVVKHFRIYLLRQHLNIVTGHAPLKCLMSLKNCPLGSCHPEYDLEVRHRAEKTHQNADALSRAFSDYDIVYYLRRLSALNDGVLKCTALPSSLCEEVV